MPGGPVGADDLVVVSHLSPQSPGREGQPVYLGYLFVEPRRHAAGLADLTEPEARAVGLWCARASRALREVAGADHVYPGTPREYQGLNADDWPGAERGTASQVADLVTRLRTYLGR